MSIKEDPGNGEANRDADQSSSHDLDRLIQFKIVYWGPGESGKTTNWRWLKNYPKFEHFSRGLTVETTDGRTLWKDSIVLNFSTEMMGHHYDFVVQLVTCTGQERFLSTREFVLDGADGVVFVGDSQPDKMEQNKRSFRELISFTKEKDVPCVVQLNKRDIPDKISVVDFKKKLGLPSVEHYEDGTIVVHESVALKGTGVIETFQDLFIAVIKNFFGVS